MTRCWVGVASRDHVRVAVHGNFCQLAHGREAPLQRLQEGDRLFYYSPRETKGGGSVLQAFTAVGDVLAGEPYQASGATFRPFRRKVRYLAAQNAGIRPLLAALSFARDGASWGLAMRRGFFEITPGDGRVISAAMGAVNR